MKFVYKGKILQTLTIPFVVTGTAKQFMIRICTEKGEQISRAYLCLLNTEYFGSIWARVKGTTKWYTVGAILNTECFLGSIDSYSFIDVEIYINLPISVITSTVRLNFEVLFGDREHGPNRNFCGKSDGTNDPLWGDDEFETPLWSGSEGGCPNYETGSTCSDSIIRYAMPAQSMNIYTLVTSYVENGVKYLKPASNSDLQNGTVVGMITTNSTPYYGTSGATTCISTDGNFIFEIGGQLVNSDGTLSTSFDNSVRMINTQTGEMVILGSCGPASIRDGSLVELNGLLYLYGGDNGAGNYYKTLYSYDPNTNTCVRLSDGPTPRAGAAPILYENQIHYLGGWNSSGPIYTVDWYDTDAGVWHTVAAPTTGTGTSTTGGGSTAGGGSSSGGTTEPPIQGGVVSPKGTGGIIIHKPTDPTVAPTQYPTVGVASCWTVNQTDREASGATTGFGCCVNGSIYWWDTKNTGVQISSDFGVSWAYSGDNETYPGFTGDWVAKYKDGKIYVSNPFLSDSSYTKIYSGPSKMYIYDVESKIWEDSGTATSPELTTDRVWTGSFIGGGAISDDYFVFWGRTCEITTNTRSSLLLIRYKISTGVWDSTIHECYPDDVTTNTVGDVFNNNKLYILLTSGILEIDLDETTNFRTELRTPSQGTPNMGVFFACTLNSVIYWLVKDSGGNA